MACCVVRVLIWQFGLSRCCKPAQKLVSTLNTGRISRETEVVVAPPSLYLGSVKSSLRGDIGVAAQVRNASHVANSLALCGVFSGCLPFFQPQAAHFMLQSECFMLKFARFHAACRDARGVRAWCDWCPFLLTFQSLLPSEHPRSAQARTRKSICFSRMFGLVVTAPSLARPARTC